jgi:hypothetical protein
MTPTGPPPATITGRWEAITLAFYAKVQGAAIGGKSKQQIGKAYATRAGLNAASGSVSQITRLRPLRLAA